MEIGLVSSVQLFVVSFFLCTYEAVCSIFFQLQGSWTRHIEDVNVVPVRSDSVVLLWIKALALLVMPLAVFFYNDVELMAGTPTRLDICHLPFVF